MQVISDLLKPDKVNLMIREDRRRGVFVDGLSEWVVRSPAEVYGLMMRGAQQVRMTSAGSRRPLCGEEGRCEVVAVGPAVCDAARSCNSRVARTRSHGLARKHCTSRQSLQGAAALLTSANLSAGL